MQREINDLKRKLCYAHQRQFPPSLDTLHDDENDDDFKQRSRTPLNETFYHVEECYQRRKCRSPSPRGLGHDAMSRALDQLFKLTFTHRIEGAALPWQF